MAKGKRFRDMNPDEQVEHFKVQSLTEDRIVHAPWSETYEELLRAVGLPVKGKRAPGSGSVLYESADADSPWRVQLDK